MRLRSRLLNSFEGAFGNVFSLLCVSHEASVLVEGFGVDLGDAREVFVVHVSLDIVGLELDDVVGVFGSA